MGKDLNGKELGEGVYQLKSGKYFARASGYGKRIGKAFDNLPSARMWLSERQLNADKPMLFNETMTLNEWYEYWIENIKLTTVKLGTYQSYERIYDNRIRDTLGHRRLQEIKLIDCQCLLNSELKKHKASTVNQTLICLQQIFNSAVDNELLEHSPVQKAKVRVGRREERRVFTADEQKRFIEHIKTHRFKYRDECLFILETGLRIGELLGLKWSDVSGGKIHVRRSMYYDYKSRQYIETTTKTDAGTRTIPLTTKAKSILANRKVTRIDYIFLKSNQTTRVNIDKSLWWACDKIGIDRISIHGLRHSFATRCIENGMNPKTLQKILGHANLNITMNLYVHVTDETLVKEMQKIENFM